MTEERAFSWDDEFTEVEDSFQIVPPGDYDFTIVDFERAHFDGSDKMPACPMAKLTYEVQTPDGTKGRIRQNLFLHSKSEWQLTNFACAVGMMQRGDGHFRIAWNQLIGATGRMQVSVRKYNGKDYNDVKRFYDKTAAPKTSQPQSQPAQRPAYTQGAF